MRVRLSSEGNKNKLCGAVPNMATLDGEDLKRKASIMFWIMNRPNLTLVHHKFISLLPQQLFIGLSGTSPLAFHRAYWDIM